MKDRSKLNSKSLKEKFPEIYADFFSKSSIVCSCPATFRWSGELSNMFGGPAAYQKLPLRIYAGIEPTGTGGVQFGSFRIFDSQKDCFKEATDIETVIVETAIRFINEYKEALPKELSNINAKIHVISEVPYGRGFNRSDTVCSAFISSLFAFKRIFGIKDLEEWKNKKTIELIDDDNNPLVKIFRIAWKITSYYQSYISSGGSNLAALLPSNYYPLIYFTEKRAGTLSNHPKDGISASVIDGHEIINDTKFWAARFDEVFDLPAFIQCPFDYAAIFTGNTRPIGNYVKASESVKFAYDQISSFIVKELGSVIPLQDKQAKKLPNFYDLSLREQGWGFWSSCIDVASASSVKIIRALKIAFKEGSFEKNIFKLIESINQCQSLVHFLNRYYTYETSKHPSYYLKDILEKKTGQKVGIKITGTDYIGDFLLVTCFDSVRQDLSKALEEAEATSGKEMFIDYASWIDGFENEGLKIEQDLDNKMYSDFITKGSMCVKSYTKDSSTGYCIVDEKRFEEEKKNIDVILDSINEKIYVKGALVGSKDLHSSITTVELLKLLLENKNHSIANSDMKKSSYSSNRNELQSKVISPFIKLIEKRLKKKINIKIKGGLDDFKILLEPSDLMICILQRSF